MEIYEGAPAFQTSFQDGTRFGMIVTPAGLLASYESERERTDILFSRSEAGRIADLCGVIANGAVLHQAVRGEDGYRFEIEATTEGEPLAHGAALTLVTPQRAVSAFLDQRELRAVSKYILESNVRREPPRPVPQVSRSARGR